MTTDGSSDMPGGLETQGHLCEDGSPLAAMRERQSAKIRAMKHALAAAGALTLDKQADALGLSRSTAWHLLNDNHKGSGISATIINRMLAAPRLPPAVRVTILEYIAEKVAGRYGDSKLGLSKFTARLRRTHRAVGTTRASDQSDPFGQQFVSHMYSEGGAVARDYAEAMRWYRRAADQSDGFAAVAISDLYQNGQSVPQDYVRAYMWLILATQTNDSAAAKMAAWQQDYLAKYKMTQAQITEAQKLAREWEADRDGARQPR
jgi:TPR repeat protein